MELCIFIKYKIELVGGTSEKVDGTFLNTKMLYLKTVLWFDFTCSVQKYIFVY
jgi:hypothetical protein